MPPVDHIRYDLLAQEALRGVVRRVLTDVARDGLPGDHHFYLSFDTRAPGVRLSQRMREQYPEDMTIVLQHQFWDMTVTEHALEVGLSFGGVPEKLLIPFSAMKGFFDPSVKFGLQFDLGTPEEEPELDGAQDTAAPAALPGTVRPLRGAASEPPVISASKPETAASGDGEEGTPPASGGAEVVRLDVFRKK
ncbi:SspB family protein [Azorhizobium doebereinerae]|uniref:SspB family protein n=1 Tax=Azorhizobium doebereinerae TaxID=281091 RepID=UPI0003F60422|nr:ClpXP protease specificity-enhancing factor SspB [Azorhizobium doebereinerae]